MKVWDEVSGTYVESAGPAPASTSNTGRLGQTTANGQGQAAPTAPKFQAAPSAANNGDGATPVNYNGQTYYIKGGSAYDSNGRAVDANLYGELTKASGNYQPERPQTGMPNVGGGAQPGGNPFNTGAAGGAGVKQTGGLNGVEGPGQGGAGQGYNTSNLTDPRTGQPTQGPDEGVGNGSAFQQYMSSLGLQLPTAGFDFASYLGPAEQVFRRELDRLAQSDPFGNQAFLQKATDRAVGQAKGFAAGARGGPGAVGGAFRQAQGVQSQLAAEGAQEMAQVKAQDERQAQAGRLAAAQGLGQLAATGVQAGSAQDAQNIEAFSAGIGAALNFEGLSQNERRGLEQLQLSYDQMDQNERSMLLQAAAEFQKIDAALYATDKNYQAQVDQNIIQKYGIDKQFQLGMEQIKSGGKLTFKDIVLGTMNAGAKVGGAIAAKSDRRAKRDIADLDLTDVRDYLAKSRGYSYKYKDPKDGKGQNFGPMAQDLKATKLGKSAVIEKNGELWVDTRRLALTDHAVLVELHKELESIKGKLK